MNGRVTMGRGPWRLAVALLAAWLLAGATFAATAGQVVNINTAGVNELEQLPMVGEARAKAIVRYRQEHGAFATVDDVQRIPDIGEATFLAIKPYLALTGTTTLAGESKAGKAKAGESAAVTVATQPGQVRLLTDQEYFPVLDGLLRQAERTIDLTMFLFKTTEASSNRAVALVQDLIAARKRGIIVSVLLEKSDYDPQLNRENEKVAARLRKEGVKVRFDSPKTTTHAKVVVIDRRYCLVGSHNFTGAALSYNHETSLLVDNQALAGALVSYMNEIP